MNKLSVSSYLVRHVEVTQVTTARRIEYRVDSVNDQTARLIPAA